MVRLTITDGFFLDSGFGAPFIDTDNLVPNRLATLENHAAIHPRKREQFAPARRNGTAEVDPRPEISLSSILSRFARAARRRSAAFDDAIVQSTGTQCPC